MNVLRKILVNKDVSCKSVWFMRQAGRYLPEFRKIRSENKDFIKLCLNSELSSNITLQPIKRFNLDAAIIFSDILLVPHMLGQNVDFKTKGGPKLDNFRIENLKNNNPEDFLKKMKPVYDSIKITREKLDKTKPLIGFVGAPWTLLIYMLNLSKDKSPHSEILLSTKIMDDVLNILNEYLCLHIKNQIHAGAEIIQIFDSWAGLLTEKNIVKFCYEPNSKLVQYCKKLKTPVICFPKGIKERYLDFNKFVKPDALNLDYDLNPHWCKDNLKNVTLQGGLNPKTLLESEDIMFEAATKYIKIFKDIPYIFNLGHGLLPETDPVRVDKLIKFYRNHP